MSDPALFFGLGVVSTLGLLLAACLIVWAAIESRNERREREALERASRPYFERGER